MYKRGISSIVASTLIILIIIISISIIWAGVIPLVSQDISDIGSKNNIEIDTIGGYTLYNPTTKLASIRVSQGPESNNIKELKITIHFGGNSYSDVVNSPGPNQKRVYSFDLNNFNEVPTHFSIIPIIEKGNEKIGGIKSPKTAILLDSSATVESPVSFGDNFSQVCGDSTCSESEVCGSTNIIPSCNLDCGACNEAWQGCDVGGESCLNIWSFSDTHFEDSVPLSYNWNWSNIFEERLTLMENNYNLGLMLGDIVQGKYDVDEMHKINKILIDNNLKNRFLWILGNHEHHWGGGSAPFTSVPYYLENISNNSYNYTREEGNILFIMAGANCEGGYCLYNDTYFDWINKTIAENQDKIIIFSAHHYYDLSISHAIRLKPIFDTYRVDVWISGHNHQFKKVEQDFVSGKTLLISEGYWECSNRQCPIRTSNISQNSIIMSFNNNSKKLSLTKVEYDPRISDTIPIFSDFGEFNLSKNFINI